jgi:predicted nucleotidyltransferase
VPQGYGWSETPNDLIGGGRSFVEARDLLKRFDREDRWFGLPEVMDFLGDPSGRAGFFLDALERNGYLELEPDRPSDAPRYTLTMKGRQLAHKKKRRISRATLDALKARVLKVAEDMAKSNEWEFEITKIVFFGSGAFPDSKLDFGDLDVAIEFAHKPQFPSFYEAGKAIQARLKDEPAHHRLWGVIPQAEVYRHLKKEAHGGAYLSLHELREVLDNAWPHIVVYDREQGGIVAPAKAA